NCFGRDRWVHHHHQGRADDAGNWRDVADEIVIELVVECGVDRVQGSRQEERVAVGRGAHDRLGGNIAARAWSILDDERLTEPLRQALAHQASDDVSRSTRRKTDNDVDWSCRIGLGPGEMRYGRERGSAGGQMQKITARKFHFEPPSRFRSLDHLVGDGEQERWHIETIALAALSLLLPFPQSIMLTPFWAPPASAARALR